MDFNLYRETFSGHILNIERGNGELEKAVFYESNHTKCELNPDDLEQDGYTLDPDDPDDCGSAYDEFENLFGRLSLPSKEPRGKKETVKRKIGTDYDSENSEPVEESKSEYKTEAPKSAREDSEQAWAERLLAGDTVGEDVLGNRNK